MSIPVLSPYAWPPAPGSTLPTDIGGTPPAPGSNLPGSFQVPPGTGEAAVQGSPPSVPTYLPGNYGDAITTAVVFAAAGALLALPRPTHGRRVLLVINNLIAGFVINVGFDAPPPVNGGIGIASAVGQPGTLFMDIVVPQNDIWIFSPAAGTVQVVYMIDNTRGA